MRRRGPASRASRAAREGGAWSLLSCLTGSFGEELLLWPSWPHGWEDVGLANPSSLGLERGYAFPKPVDSEGLAARTRRGVPRLGPGSRDSSAHMGSVGPTFQAGEGSLCVTSGRAPWPGQQGLLTSPHQMLLVGFPSLLSGDILQGGCGCGARIWMESGGGGS